MPLLDLRTDSRAPRPCQSRRRPERIAGRVPVCGRTDVSEFGDAPNRHRPITRAPARRTVRTYPFEFFVFVLFEF